MSVVRRTRYVSLLLVAAAFSCRQPWIAPSGEAGAFRLVVVERRIPRPPVRDVQGPLPRAVFLAQVVERDGPFDETARTRYCLFDPSDAGAGFRDVFSAPGEDQYCRLVSPLYGGAGIAVGHVDPRGEPGADRLIFWFDLAGGEVRETIGRGPFMEWTAGREVRYLTEEGIHRLDPVAGRLRTCAAGLLGLQRIGEDAFLGIAEVGGEWQVVRLDLAHETLVALGPVPAAVRDGIAAGSGILPAGPDAADGVYVTFPVEGFSAFSLWFKPARGPWRPVAEGVHVVKTSGGRFPWLPAAYLGGGRFAVAKTVADEAPGPHTEEGFPRAVGVTVLVDGSDGRVLEETDPEVYEWMPPLSIPEPWWSEEVRAARRALEEARVRAGAFTWDAAAHAFRCADGSVVETTDEDAAHMSQDGRYLALCRKWSTHETPPARLSFRIFDGVAGTRLTPEISSSRRTLFVNAAAWQVLCAPGGEPPDFTPAPPNPWYDPWW